MKLIENTNKHQYDCVQFIVACDEIRTKYSQLGTNTDKNQASISPEIKKKLSDLWKNNLPKVNIGTAIEGLFRMY